MTSLVHFPANLSPLIGSLPNQRRRSNKCPHLSGRATITAVPRFLLAHIAALSQPMTAAGFVLSAGVTHARLYPGLKSVRDGISDLFVQHAAVKRSS